MESSINPTFKRDYQTHLQHLSLKGLQPKTTEAYARAIRLPDIVSIEEAERRKKKILQSSTHNMRDCRTRSRSCSWT